MGLSTTERMSRASKYILKIPPAIAKQGGHDQTLYAACQTLRKFNLTKDELASLLAEYSATCEPPWSARELAHKVDEAFKKVPENERGQGEDQQDSGNRPKPIPKAHKPPENPADLLRDELMAVLDGRRSTVEFSHRLLSTTTGIGDPGTVAVHISPQGGAKSAFYVQEISHFNKQGIPAKALMLEDDIVFHMRRGLAQLNDNSFLTRNDYIVTHQEECKRAFENKYELLNKLGSSIEIAPDEVDTDCIIQWVRDNHRDTRILIVDPMSARDPSLKPWIDDHKLLRELKNTVRGKDCTIICCTHPPKRTQRDTAQRKTWGDDVAGGASILRLAHTVLYVEALKEPEAVTVRGEGGLTKPEQVNRIFQLRKTRNGCGQFMEIGFYFDPKTLLHRECGFIL